MSTNSLMEDKQAGEATAIIRSPANLALIKYWGKSDPEKNFPANDSLSFVFESFWTQCEISTHSHTTSDVWQLFEYTDKELFQPLNPTPNFFEKGKKQLERIRLACGDARALTIKIGNNFPHGCGIASSASSMSALTTAALSAYTRSNSMQQLASHGWPLGKVAALSRLGSGSACRSFLPGFSWWERGDSPESQSVSSIEVHPDLQIMDTLVLVSSTPKEVPSSTGHLSAFTSPLYSPRLEAIPERIALCQSYMLENSFDQLGSLCEQEALDLHAIAMSATPSANYLLPKTSDILTWVRKQRKSSGIRFYFTLDAGANVHILSRTEDSETVKNLVNRSFPALDLMQSGVGSGIKWMDKADWPRSEHPNFDSLKRTEGQQVYGV